MNPTNPSEPSSQTSPITPPASSPWPTQAERAQAEQLAATPLPQATQPETPQTTQPEQPVEFGSWSKIVIVEDNIAIADIYKTRMEMTGYICFVAHEGNEALRLIEKERPSLVLLDLMVPEVAGDQILKRMRASEWGKDIKVLIISNLNEEDAPAGLRMQGIEGYAVKANLTDDQLDQLVDNILKRSAEQASAPTTPVA